MTNTHGITNKVIKSALALLAVTLLSQSASAISLTASRHRTVARCSGDFDVKVIDWASYGLALYIYEDGHLVTSQRVKKSSSDDGRVEMTYFKTRSSVLDGGASLRIRSRDNRIPATAGTAWLTFDRQNARLDCAVY